MFTQVIAIFVPFLLHLLHWCFFIVGVSFYLWNELIKNIIIKKNDFQKLKHSEKKLFFFQFFFHILGNDVHTLEHL